MTRIASMTLFSAVAAWGGMAPIAMAADVNRHISVELDPLSPMAAVRESNEGKPTSMFGGGVDFNLGNISTGPEVWTGNFTRKGPTEDCEATMRVADLQCGDQAKLDAVRLRWTIGIWESHFTMRGLFLKGGYSYTKIQSRSTRSNIQDSAMRGIPADPTTAQITDMRQGGVATIGQRWAFWDHTGTVTLAMSYTADIRRSVTAEGTGDLDLAREDYDRIIERIQDTRMSVRPMPEFNLGFGYLW